MRTHEIDIFTELSAQEFFEKFSGLAPFILKNHIFHWPAMKSWNPEYLKHHYGDLSVPVVLYDPESDLTFLEQTASDVHKTVTLRDYLTSLEFGDRKYAIREETTLFERVPRLLNDLAFFSPFCTAEKLSSICYKSLWVGPANYITGLHTDPGHTLLFQIYGAKRIILFRPDQEKYLYRENPAKQQRMLDNGRLQLRVAQSDFAVLRNKVGWCAVNPFYPDPNRFPLFDEAEGIEAFVHPGDTLYIPDQWWHAVRALETTISVSIEPSTDGFFFVEK